MKICSSLFLLFLLASSVYSQDQSVSELSVRRLRWSHFTVVEDDNTVFKANISYIAREKVDTTTRGVRIDFKLVIDPNKSWVKNGHSTRRLLRHEQIHLDLAELQLRKLKKRLSEAQSMQQYTQLVEEARLKEDRLQKEFDDLTDYGSNMEENDRYYRQIKKELRSFRRFRRPVWLNPDQ